MDHSTPPPKAPQVLSNAKTTYVYWLEIYRRIPKPERFGIGERLDKLFLDLLETLFECRFSSRRDKSDLLDKSIKILDKIKFLTEVLWESKLVKTTYYSELLLKVNVIGKELGGWKKMIVKTPDLN